MLFVLTVCSTIIKKTFRPLGLNAGILTQGKDSEGDLVFSFRNACIEGGLEKLDDFLDAKCKACGEDIPV